MAEIFSTPIPRRRFLTTSALVAGGALGAGSLLQACGTNSSPDAGTTTLTFLAPGSPPTEWSKVLTAVNKKLQTDNTGLALNIEWISWANYVNTILLKMTANDKFDALLTAVWAHRDQFISDQTIMPLDKYLGQAPNLRATIPDLMWNANKVNGQTYVIPMTFSLDSSLYGFVLRKDLRVKYGLPPLKTMDDLEKFLYKVKANEPNMVPYGFHKDDTAKTFSTYDWENAPGIYHSVDAATSYITIDRQNPKVVPYWERQGYQDALKRTRRYVQDGIISQNSLNLSDSDMLGLFSQGKFAVAPSPTDGTVTPPTPVQAPGAELEVLFPYTQPHPKPLNTFIAANLIAIHSTSPHPDKVVALMDWLSIKENHDLLEYGVPNTDWKAIGNTSYRSTSQYNFAANSGYVISWRPTLERVSNSMLPDAKTWFEFASDANNFTADPYGPFVFDTTSVNTQISQLNAIVTQYQIPLEHGIVDPDQGLTQMKQAFKQAGYDQILAEVQKQVTAFAATLK
jgi:putative aldouronate transport system substrate-binding protein